MDDPERGSAVIWRARAGRAVLALCGLAPYRSARRGGRGRPIDCIHADVAHWLYVIGIQAMVACF